VRRHLVCLILFLLWSPAWGAPPQRIVSLAPAMTEILFDLGVGERVVGVTSFCDRPPQARQRSKVGGMANPSLEAVMALKPDLVVMTADGNPKGVARRLERLGVETFVFRGKRLREIPTGIRELGERIGARKEAERLAMELERTVERCSCRSRSGSHVRKKVLFVLWPDPLMVAGPGTLIDDVVSLAGFENIAADAGTPYPRFAVEEVLRRSPDAIIFGRGHGDMANPKTKLLRRLERLQAVQGGHVFSAGDALYRPGPRIPDGIDELIRFLTTMEGGRGK